MRGDATFSLAELREKFNNKKKTDRPVAGAGAIPEDVDDGSDVHHDSDVDALAEKMGKSAIAAPRR